MIASFGDDGSAIAVSHENHRPVHGVDRRLCVLLVLGVGSLGVLHHRHLVPIIHEDFRDGFPPGAIGESTMHQDHVLNMLFHDYSPLQYSLIVRSSSNRLSTIGNLASGARQFYWALVLSPWDFQVVI